MTQLDPVDLTRHLISLNSVNPPGNERPIALMLDAILSQSGFQTKLVDYEQNRSSLIAWCGSGDKPALCMTGHMDVVPLGQAPWTQDPFAGTIEGDRLFGRGASDMKGGVAAMVTSAIEARHRFAGLELVLVITADEEVGCTGAKVLFEGGHLNQKVGAILVCEPTSNLPDLGHKGSLWLEAILRGVTAHGSTPHLGENAVYKAAEKVLAVRDFQFDPVEHPLYGRPTHNVGNIKGGLNINSVPDRASFHIDIRTVPSMDHQALTNQFKQLLGPETQLREVINVEPVETDPQDPWIQDCLALLKDHQGQEPPIRGGVYVTDASVLAKAYGKPPVLVLGPGDFAQAHKTDESCSVSLIHEAHQLYLEILKRWSQRP
ncbi:MAG: M20 family metallopeptidase [bacterium]|nr:M20 family metallopeptidase [bacterium]